MTNREVIEFLQRHSWIVVNENAKFIYLKPPADLGFDEKFSLPIPINKEKTDYEDLLNRAIDTICQIYEQDRNELFYDVGNYLETLKSNAIFFKIDSEEVMFDRTLEIDNIYDFLKNLNSSYRNYLKIDFQKRFENVLPTKTINKIYKQVLRYTSLRLVDLEFASFSFGVATDQIMGKDQIEHKDVADWRRDVLSHYKNEVINIDFNSKEEVEALLNKFSDRERKKIFEPLISSINSKDYKVSITNPKFERKKTYSRIPKSTVDVLFPAVNPEDEEPSFEVMQIIIPVDKSKDSFTIKRKQLEEDLFSTVKRDFPFTVDGIDFHNEYRHFNNPIIVQVEAEEGGHRFYVSYDPLNISLVVNEFKSIRTMFVQALGELYGQYLDLLDQKETNEYETIIIDFFNTNLKNNR